MEKQLKAPVSEEAYLEHIAALKALYDEVRSFVHSGYDGPFMGEDIRGIMQTLRAAEATEKKIL